MKKIFFVSMCIILLCLGYDVLAGSQYADSYMTPRRASSGDIIQTFEEMKQIVEKKYSLYPDCKIEIKEKNVSVNNLSQERLNNQYNNRVYRYNTYNKIYAREYITGTCTEVADTMATKYYCDNEQISIDDYECFKSNIDYATSKGYFPKEWKLVYDSPHSTYLFHHEVSGTMGDVIDDILDNSFKNNGLSKEHFYSTEFIGERVKESTNRGKVNLLDLSNHSVISVGYVDFIVTYKATKNFLFFEWEEDCRKVETFITVCDGWYDMYASSDTRRVKKDLCFSYIYSNLYFDNFVRIN